MLYHALEELETIWMYSGVDIILNYVNVNININININ